jgi:hypothetical protein
MHESHITPTQEQWEQSGIVQTDILETMVRLTTEGMDWRIVLTGTSAALAHLVMAHAGPDEVPIFFARTAAQTMHLAEDKPKH